MKKLIFIILLLPLTGILHGQTLNQKIVKYCKSQLGKKVDRGECWDLIAFALNDAGATWNKYDVYGKVYELKNQKVEAGDVLEFHDVRFENPDGSWFTMGEHYAIVYEVKANNEIVIIHQNHNNIRTVQTLTIDLDNTTEGKIIYYHPE